MSNTKLSKVKRHMFQDSLKQFGHKQKDLNEEHKSRTLMCILLLSYEKDHNSNQD